MKENIVSYREKQENFAMEAAGGSGEKEKFRFSAELCDEKDYKIENDGKSIKKCSNSGDSFALISPFTIRQKITFNIVKATKLLRLGIFDPEEFSGYNFRWPS